MTTTILRAADRVPSVWANGSGVTTEVARSAAEPFEWRISIATISSDGPFSVLPGVDRILLPLSHQGLTLVVNGRPVTLARWEQIAFRGEDDVASVDVTAPSLDLNLMTRRGVTVGSLELLTVASHLGFNMAADASDTLVAVILSGELTWEGHALSPHDALMASGDPVTLKGEGTIAVAAAHQMTLN